MKSVWKPAAASFYRRDTEKRTSAQRDVLCDLRFSSRLCGELTPPAVFRTPPPTRKRPHRRDSGFALLLVFLMAAVLAISLYMEVPRVAFETQRQKEQMLMERGEQYKIAIRRFCQANGNRWPSKIEDLENFNNRRFLRHRYIDPMTGKDEWRLIHIQNGVLTDSINNKQKQKTDDQSAPNAFIAEFTGLGGSTTQGQATVNPALRRRPSEGGAPATDAYGQPIQNSTLPPGVPPLPGSTPVPGGSVAANPTGTVPPGVPAPPGMPMPPGVTAPPSSSTINSNPANSSSGGLFGNNSGSPIGTGGAVGAQANNPTGQAGVYAGRTQLPGLPGNPVSTQFGGVSPYNTAAGANGSAPGYPQPGVNTGTQPGQSNAAIGMINQILTSPRPGGLAGIQAANGQPTTIGGGIAGFASTVDADSIMVYNDHTNYSEWEFIFDPTKWVRPPNPNQGAVGTPVNQIGSMPTGGPGGTPVSAMSSSSSTSPSPSPGFGASSFGGATGAGTASIAGGPAGQQPGQPGQQQGQGMTNSTFGGGGMIDIRPGRR